MALIINGQILENIVIGIHMDGHVNPLYVQMVSIVYGNGARKLNNNK